MSRVPGGQGAWRLMGDLYVELRPSSSVPKDLPGSPGRLGCWEECKPEVLPRSRELISHCVRGPVLHPELVHTQCDHHLVQVQMRLGWAPAKETGLSSGQGQQSEDTGSWAVSQELGLEMGLGAERKGKGTAEEGTAW